MTSGKYESVVGITRNAIITVFNTIDRDDYIRYVINEIFPIIEHRYIFLRILAGASSVNVMSH